MRKSFGGIPPYFDDSFGTELADELYPSGDERRSLAHPVRHARLPSKKVEKIQKNEETQENES